MVLGKNPAPDIGKGTSKRQPRQGASSIREAPVQEKLHKIL
jgi:hypothetical protein